MAIRNVTPVKLPFKVTPVIVVIAVIVILALIAASTGIYQVGAEETAVILFLGKKKDGTVGPGLHFKLPFGIEQNYNVLTKRIITQEFGFRTKKVGLETQYAENYPDESEMLSSDKNIVDIQFIIHYQIDDPVAWIINVQHLVKDDYAEGGVRVEKNLRNERDLWYEKTIRDLSQSVINMQIGDRNIRQIIGSETERNKIQIETRDMLNTVFVDYEMGVKVTEVALRNTLPPKGKVRDAFENVNKADQDKERYINEGYEAYNKAVEEAKGTKNRMIEEATGYSIQRKNIANGDISRFNAVLEEYRKAPDITRERLYIEMFESVFGGESDTDLIDRNLKNFIPFKSIENAKQGGE
ncbi:MAG: FtsH protease activity modulator HflK [Spirochaetales bacterium]|nr:FtsH protease activity modulator HflK [Spirochaetales bacterium]